MKADGRNRASWLFPCLWLAMLALSLLAGRYAMTPGQVLTGLLAGPAGEGGAALLWNIRLPRALLTAVGGGGLALAGLAFQTVFSNPLVSPDILGVANGCSVGAVCAMLFFPGLAGGRELSAFLCGLAAVACALALARVTAKDQVLGMVLAGIVISGLSSALLMLLKFVADPQRQLPAIEYWLMGGFQNGTWERVISVLILTVPAAAVLYSGRFSLKVLSLGDEQAQALGLRPGRVRLLAVGCATVLVAAVVASAGVVSWIGLMAPHLVRAAGRRDVTRNMPAVFFTGGALLMGADLFARTLTAAEIPVSIFTSLFGAVLLAYFLVRSRRKGAEPWN